jgi:hypothetical protein
MNDSFPAQAETLCPRKLARVVCEFFSDLLDTDLSRGAVRLRAHPGIRRQAPYVSWNQGLEPDMVLLEAGELRNPNHPKFCFVLPILNSKLTANLELAADETQPDAGFVDVQGMSQIAVGGTRGVIAGDPHWQNGFSSVVTTAVIHFNSLLDLLRDLTETILRHAWYWANSPNGWASPS